MAIENQTPLHLAAEEGYLDMAEVLLDHGADVNAANADGDTPLHLSLKRELMLKSSEMVNLHYSAMIFFFLVFFSFFLGGRGGRGSLGSVKCFIWLKGKKNEI